METEMGLYSPMEVAVALSLYAYNVDAETRARKLYDYFNGDCMEVEDLVTILSTPHVAFAATELPPSSALVYVQQALEKYGRESRKRCKCNGI